MTQVDQEEVVEIKKTPVVRDEPKEEKENKKSFKQSISSKKENIPHSESVDSKFKNYEILLKIENEEQIKVPKGNL